MMYLPNHLEPLDWTWDSINYEVYCNQLNDAPDGSQQKFVEWCVGWGREMGRWSQS